MADDDGVRESADEPDDDVVDDEPDDGDDAGGDGDDTPDGDSEPSARSELERLKNIAEYRKSERDKARAAKDKLKARVQELERALGGKKSDAAEADSAAEAEAAAEESKWRVRAAKASAASQLQGAGFSGDADQAKMLTVLLGADTAEPDDDLEFDFREAIEDLRERLPQLFRSEEEKPRVRRPTVADKGRQADRDATSDPTKRTSDMLLRQAGVDPRRRGR